MSFDAKNREKKREVQLSLTEELSASASAYPEIRQGTVLALSGPMPLEAIWSYFDKEVGNRYLLIENDLFTFQSALQELNSLKLDSKTFKLKNEDIFKTQLPEDITGLDLDFCSTLTGGLAVKILRLITKINNDKFWVRLTTSIRGKGTSRKSVDQALDIMEGYLQLTNFKLTDKQRVSYKSGRDGRGITMYCWQVFCHKKEQEMKKTLRQLTNEQKDIARALVNGLGYRYRYTDKDIAKTLGITPQSVAALKAHRTMGNLN